MVFSDHFQGSDATPPPVSAKEEWPLSEMKVAVESKLEMASLPEANEALLSDCRKVGKSILNRFRLYDSGSILPRLSKDRQNNYSLRESTLRDLDLSVLQVWVAKSFKSGSGFTLEVRLIPPSILIAEAPNVDLHTLDEAARINFDRANISAMMNTPITRVSVSANLTASVIGDS